MLGQGQANLEVREQVVDAAVTLASHPPPVRRWAETCAGTQHPVPRSCGLSREELGALICQRMVRPRNWWENPWVKATGKHWLAEVHGRHQLIMETKRWKPKAPRDQVGGTCCGVGR